jgi:hypothetical protein
MGRYGETIEIWRRAVWYKYTIIMEAPVIFFKVEDVSVEHCYTLEPCFSIHSSLRNPKKPQNLLRNPYLSTISEILN